ncbi:hypothetical protein [Sphingobium sp.]|uniref:hypothetical protein n=1 Tax=Sphingobium sp. TaxID=1912891 RepID=UPI002E1F8EBB
MTEITPYRIELLKAELAGECSRIAADLGLDVEGEAIRHGLFTPKQARGAFDGGSPRVSLARLVDFMFTLRTLYNYSLPDDGFTPDAEDDDGIPW